MIDKFEDIKEENDPNQEEEEEKKRILADRLEAKTKS